jgi:hypothetical protein
MYSNLLMLWLLLKAAMLLLAFFGLGMYLRGFWVYFGARRWLWEPAQSMVRRQYKSSVVAALLRDPGLMAAKRQVMLGLMGLPLFAIGGAVFNALAKPF